MDKVDQITKNKNSISNLAVDGLLFGLVGGIAMFSVLAIFTMFSGGSAGSLLQYFNPGGLTSPGSGLISHLAVSAIYGLLFGVLVWPVARRLWSTQIAGLLAGLVYGILLLFLAQIAILPGTNSPLVQIPFWQWAVAHGIYGVLLGVLFSRKS